MSALTITTTARTAQAQPSSERGSSTTWLAGGMALAGLLMPVTIMRRSRWTLRQMRYLALLLVSAVAVSGCGGGGGSSASTGTGGSSTSSGSSGSSSSGGAASGTPAGTSVITITATVGSTTQTTNFSLTVN
jgi:uncharacterized membrane protein YgcG